MPPLPGEILDEIFSHLDDDKPSLSNCTCVCRILWFPFATQHLFHTVRFTLGHSPHNPHRNTYKDFATFLADCPRAGACIRNLTITGHVSAAPLPATDLPFEPTDPGLATDLLVQMLQHLPVLRSLRIVSVHLVLPALSVGATNLAASYQPRALSRLEMDYGVYSRARTTIIHPLSVIRLFPSIDHVHIVGLPTIGTFSRGPLHTHIPHVTDVEGSSGGRIASLSLDWLDFTALTEALVILPIIVPQAGLITLSLSLHDGIPLLEVHPLLDEFIQECGSRLQTFSLEVVISDFSLFNRKDSLEGFGLPSLSTLDSITTLNFTFIFDLTTTFGTTEFMQALITMLLSVLPSQPPPEQPSIRLAFTFFDNHLEDDENRRDTLILELAESIEWWRLEAVVEALGWSCRYPVGGVKRMREDDTKALTVALQHTPLLRGATHPFEDGLRERVTEIIRRRMSFRLRGGIKILK